MVRTAAERSNPRTSIVMNAFAWANSAPAMPARVAEMVKAIRRWKMIGVPIARIRARFSLMPRSPCMNGDALKNLSHQNDAISTVSAYP